MKYDAFFNLFTYCLGRFAVGWVEGVVIAETASSSADVSVAVGTSEAGVDADFLHASAKKPLEVGAVTVETTAVAPWEYAFCFVVHRAAKIVNCE